MIDWTADQSDKFIGTTAAILSAVAAGAAASSSIYAAHKQGDAATKAATLQTEAAKYGADKQDAAAQRAEAFQRQQAENAYQNAQTTQRANYDQAKARLGTIAGVGAQYGLSGISMPDYVPGVDPHYDTGASPLPGAPGASMPGTSGAPASSGDDPRVAAFVADWQKSHPVSEGIAPLADALQKAGLSPGRFDYGGGKLSNNEVTVGGKPYKVLGGEGSPAAYWYQPGTNDSAPGARGPAASTLGSFVSPAFASLAPTTQMPTLYQPGTLGASLRRL